MMRPKPDFLGIVVNPKSAKPVFVQREDATQATIQIFTADGYGDYRYMGTGYLDSGDDESRYAVGCHATNIPRCHTPDGVQETGTGYGTTLYTGLVLLAKAKRTVQGMFCGSEASIHSIPGNRSNFAERWWRSAKKNGLAEVGYAEVEGDPEERQIDLTDLSSRARSTVEGAVSDGYEDGYVSSVNSGAFDVTVDGGMDEIEIDVITFDDLIANNLLALYSPRVGSWEQWGNLEPIDPDRDVLEKDVLLALNLSDEDDQTTTWFLRLAREAGATPEEMAQMKVRADFKIDDRTLPLPFPEPTGEPAEKPVPNPARRRRPVARRTTRRNPPASATRQIEQALRDVERRRARLGWKDLEDL